MKKEQKSKEDRELARERWRNNFRKEWARVELGKEAEKE